MRFVVFGAGAVGGVVGGRLFQHGHDVVLVARGEHHAALRHRGLRLEWGEESAVLEIPAVDDVGSVQFAEGDVVLLAVKSQDTEDALRALAAHAKSGTPVVCLQNGVENERAALRRFAGVYGVPVMCPTEHLEPGVVRAYSAPVTGILDVGRYPRGTDDVTAAVSAAFEASTFDSREQPEIMRWKYRKLLLNLGNAVQAVCGADALDGRITELATAEGEACLAAAGIDVAGAGEEAERRGDLLQMRPAGGARWRGGSSWQSLARGTGSIESDYLNGEIVLLGRLHGVPTPANAVLRELAADLARRGAEPGAMSEDEVLARAGVSA